MIDPWLTNDPLWPKAEREPGKLREVDVVAVTHAHFDHAPRIEEIASLNDKVIIVAQYEFTLSLINRGVRNVMPTSCGATIDLLGMRFSSAPAAHSSSTIDENGLVRIVGIRV